MNLYDSNMWLISDCVVIYGFFFLEFDDYNETESRSIKKLDSLEYIL